MEILNSGYLPEEPKPEDHVLGGVTVGGLPIIGKPDAPIIFDNSYSWLDAIGAERGEIQANDNFDTYMCTIFGVGGAISDYMKKAYNFDLDFSECIQGVLAGVTPGRGGTIRNSLESFRTQGWAEESYRKFTESTTQAQCFAVVTSAIRKICAAKLNDWDIYWELIDGSNNVSHAKITESLKKYEVVVAGWAWSSYYGNEGVFNSYNNGANHCFRIGAGGEFPQVVKDKFKGREYEIDWSLVDLIAIDSYRFNWIKDPENDHQGLNDFLKPLAKEYRIESAYGVYVLPKGKKKIQFTNFLTKSMKELQAYMDDHGLHIWYIDKRGKQEIPLTTMFEKALAMSYVKQGVIKTTSYPKIASLPNFTFF